MSSPALGTIPGVDHTSTPKSGTLNPRHCGHPSMTQATPDDTATAHSENAPMGDVKRTQQATFPELMTTTGRGKRYDTLLPHPLSPGLVSGTAYPQAATPSNWDILRSGRSATDRKPAKESSPATGVARFRLENPFKTKGGRFSTKHTIAKNETPWEHQQFSQTLQELLDGQKELIDAQKRTNGYLAEICARQKFPVQEEDSDPNRADTPDPRQTKDAPWYESRRHEKDFFAARHRTGSISPLMLSGPADADRDPTKR